MEKAIRDHKAGWSPSRKPWEDDPVVQFPSPRAYSKAPWEKDWSSSGSVAPWEKDWPDTATPRPSVLSKLARKGDDLVRGVADAVTFGFADEIAAGLSAVTGIGDYSGNVARERERDRNASVARNVGQIVGSFIPVVGAATKGVNTVRGAVKAGAAYGGAYGLGSGEGGIEDRLDDAAIGAAIGAVGGAALAKAPALAKYLAKNATPTQRFVNREAGSAFAAFDAEVASDVSRIVSELPKGIGKQGRKATIATKVAALEKKYLPSKSAIDAMDIPPSQKLALKTAIDNRHALDASEIQALRGSTAGDAVADGILKAQRLKLLVPNGAPTRSWMSKAGHVAMDAVGVAAGSMIGGPALAAGVRVATHAGRKMLGSASAADAATDAAIALTKRKRRYAALAERVGSSGARESAEALTKAAGEALDAKHLTRKSAALRKAQEATESAQLAAANKRIAMLNFRDNVRPTGGFRGYLYDRTGLLPVEQDQGVLRMLADKVITPKQLDDFLRAPDRLQKGNAGNAILDRLASLADDGTLKRDPKWTPRTAEATAPAAEGIRNPLAYAATAKGNQQRVSDTLARVQQEDRFGPKVTADIASAISRLGSISDRAEADRLLKATMGKLPKEAREYARTALEPLAKAIKRKD